MLRLVDYFLCEEERGLTIYMITAPPLAPSESPKLWHGLIFYNFINDD